MGQKTIAKLPIKTDRVEFIQETKDQAFFEPRTKELDLKRLNQSIQNLDLGMDFLQKVESLLHQIKQLAAPRIESNLDFSGRSTLDTEISFKKLDIATQLKQRSKSLNILLQEIKQYQDISIANQKAAQSAPDSIAKAEEFLRTINLLT